MQYVLTSGSKDIQLSIYSSIEDAKSEWNAIVPDENVFLQEQFLRVLEEYPPEGMQYRYLIFKDDQNLFGVAYCQVQYFKADESINQPIDGDDPCFFKAIGKSLRDLVSKMVEFNSLVCGNLLLTGEHGYYFDYSKVEQKQAYELLVDALNTTIQHLSKEGINTPLIFLKDYFPDTSSVAKKVYAPAKFHDFEFQPNMLLNIHPEWSNFDDYLSAMSSKYRVRARRAFKKGKDFSKRELSLEEIDENRERIYELYEMVLNHAGFNTMVLNKEYFFGLKKRLEDNFQLVGYYLNDELVGFYTTIINHEELEAHFLGFDHTYNRTHQIYLNMLYDMIKRGIYCGSKQLVFARTALEIKSSVGAVAHDMQCYLRLQNKLHNRLLMKSIVNYLNTPEEWTPRHPFKA